MELTVAACKLEKFHIRAETVKEDLSNAQADVSLYTTFQEKARKQRHKKF